MQMARALLCAASLATGWAAKAPRSLRAETAHAGATTKEGGQALVIAPVLEVDVPVMVVVEDEGDSGMSDAPSGLGDLSRKCRVEVANTASNMSKTAAAKVNRCEHQGNYTDKALQALQEANATQAKAYVVQTFSKCAGISQVCAEEMAPAIVLRARFSGMAVSAACMDVAQSLDPKATEEQKQCMNNSSEAQVVQLQRLDTEGAVLEAQRGLSSCSKVKPPCDFQLAPMLVTQLLQVAQATMQREVQQMLLQGLRQSAEFREKLAASGTKRVAQSPPSQAQHAKALNTSAPPAKSAKKAPKKLSLLSLAQGVRISSTRRAVF